jgi:signal transduction histidine kinase
MVGNAANYTKEGGITVETQKVDGFVKVLVIDTGVGISELNQQRLFKKFQQAQAEVLTRDLTKSTGLGLYISKLIVEGLGGEIKLEHSEVGKGSTFSFSIPIAKEMT